MKQKYTIPILKITATHMNTSLLANSWEMQDGNGNKEDDFGIIEGDPEGGLSSKSRWSLWD